MIRALIEQTFDATKKYYVMCGLSTDTKPTSGLITGSQFHEVDTGTKYEFDEVNSLWHVVGITEDEIKAEIDAWLDYHPEATTTVQDGAISYAKLDSSLKGTVDDVADLKTEIQNKANVDGSYSSLTAGNAEQLVSTVGVNDKTPYLFRTTGGSADVGDRVKLSEITGGTVAWNQIFVASYSRTVNGLEYTKVDNGHVKLNGAYSNTSPWYVKLTRVSVINHVYFVDKGTDNNHYSVYNDSCGVDTLVTRRRIVGKATANKNFYQRFVDGATFDNETIAPQIFDLTQMFGSTIADYIYGLEQANAGAGVAWFHKLFPKPYYAYDAGTLLSVKTTAHKEYGFNAYDNTTGKAKVVGGQVYQITGTYTALSLDGTSITPDASGYFTPAASGELTVTGGNSTDTCIHLKWDGERDGEYEPYVENSYPLDSDIELRGIPKLDASNNLYYDGDSYAPDGTVTRKYGIVDLGTLTYTKNSGAWRATIPDRKYAGSGLGYIDSIIVGYAYDFNLGSDMTYAFSTSNNGYVWFRNDIYTTADAFKTAMSGVYLVYKLAAPTTESADPYQETQVCNDFGTEEFVDSRTVPMPVGANALYQANLRAKLEMAPDSPDGGNGDYIVRQTDGTNEYVALSDNSIVSGLVTRCPVCPTDTDGNFVLKAVVSSGSVTYSWVAEA